MGQFITRLEQKFRVAYGQEKMSRETKEVIMFVQLQEGLQLDLLKSPSVSSALSYSELCGAARNEEQRQAGLKKDRSIGRRKQPGESNPSNLLGGKQGCRVIPQPFLGNLDNVDVGRVDERVTLRGIVE